MAIGGSSPEARLAAAEHQRQVVLLRIRGIAFDAIGKQLGMTKQSAHTRGRWLGWPAEEHR